MILNSRSVVAACRPFVLRPNCFSSNINTEQLRAQLDQLHAEAETTRAKASSARLRLLRLSEAAEKLKRQAAINFHTGKGNDAKELLFQKKKVIQAMEKSKNRIELIDELSAKLNELTQDPSRLVRMVSPKQKVEEQNLDDKDFDPDGSKPGDSRNQILQFSADSQSSSLVDQEMEDCQGSVGVNINAEDNTISSLRGISSFCGFSEYLDQRLNNIEAELVTILNVSTLKLNKKEKPKEYKGAASNGTS